MLVRHCHYGHCPRAAFQAFWRRPLHCQSVTVIYLYLAVNASAPSWPVTRSTSCPTTRTPSTVTRSENVEPPQGYHPTQVRNPKVGPDMSASSGTCHRGGTNKSNPEERSGRLRCDFSSCRQWRHTIDQCWKAHPELRPCSHGRRRLVNGALTNYSKTHTFDLANRARAPPAHFRFLDLPAELQNRIYEEAYKEPHTLTIVETSDPNLPYGNATVRFTRSAPHNLHAACQKTFNDTTHLLGNGGFDGHLRCADGPIDWFNYDDR